MCCREEGSRMSREWKSLSLCPPCCWHCSCGAQATPQLGDLHQPGAFRCTVPRPCHSGAETTCPHYCQLWYCAKTACQTSGRTETHGWCSWPGPRAWPWGSPAVGHPCRCVCWPGTQSGASCGLGLGPCTSPGQASYSCKARIQEHFNHSGHSFCFLFFLKPDEGLSSKSFNNMLYQTPGVQVKFTQFRNFLPKCLAHCRLLLVFVKWKHK